MPTNARATDNVRIADSFKEFNDALSLCGQAVNKLARELAGALFRGKQTNGAQASAQNRAAGNAAPTGNAAPNGNAAPPRVAPTREAQAVCEATNWLKRECGKIKTALASINPNTEENEFDDHTGQRLHLAAKEFKDSMQAYLTANGGVMPADLRGDFQSNIDLMESFFKGDTNQPININELKFLTAYIKHLKHFIKGEGNELEESLDQVSTRLKGLLRQSAEEVDTAGQDLQKAKDDVGKKVDALKAANDAVEAASTPASLQRPGGQVSLDAALERQANATTELATARGVVTTNENKFENLKRLPSNLERELLQADVETANLEIRALAREHIRITNGGGTDAEKQAALEQVQNMQAHRDRLKTQIAELDPGRHTISLVKQNQTKAIQATLVGAGANAENIGDHLVKQIIQDLEHVHDLMHTQKKLDTDFVKPANDFVKAIKELETNPNAVITVPNIVANVDGIQDGITAKRVRGVSLFKHAVNILSGQGDFSANGDFRGKATVKDKKLALAIVAGYAVSQAVRNTDNLNINKIYDNRADKVSAKALEITEKSGMLLAASLTLKEQQLTSTPATSHACKMLFLEHATEFNLNELQKTLDTLPDNTSVKDLIAAFENEVNLKVAKAVVANTKSAKTLLDETKTDRTYNNDLTIMNGKSRQKALKEAMLSAFEILKTNRDPEANGSRLSRASDAELNMEKNHINSLLGLLQNADGNDNSPRINGDSEFLNQMFIAATVHNDLSTEEDFVPRGSMANHIKKYRDNPTIEGLKNHKLQHFDTLSKTLIDIGIAIRPEVEVAVNNMKTRLRVDQQAANAQPISNSEVQRLVKQIVVTTDYQAAHNENFDLVKLVESADALGKSNTAENRENFHAALENVGRAWTEAKAANNNTLTKKQWNGEDKRTFGEKTLKANPIKSIPVLNRITGLSTIVAACLKTAQVLLMSSYGAVDGTVRFTAIVGFVVLGVPAYYAGQNLKRAF